jgi:hypothetical protein
MDNPWKHISFSDYERHMSDPAVGQLQVLNSIFREQYATYHPASLTVFGICSGNGLEHVDPAVTSLVTGLDVNGEYLRECSSRFSSRGYRLHLIEADLNLESVHLPPSNLFVANLFLEYVDIQKFLSAVKECAADDAVVSIVIQVNHSESFVSVTAMKSLEVLSTFHVDVSESEMVDTMIRNSFEPIFAKKYPLPGKKEFLRHDFRLR